MEPENPLLDDFTLSLTARSRPRVCFLPTASGDSEDYTERFYQAFPPSRADATHLSLFARDDRSLRDFLLSQDVIYVGGGNTANMLAIWRLHNLDKILTEAWQRGIVLTGVSAGMICWFTAGVTDSFGPLAPLADGLALIRGSACPHFDGEPERRPSYHQMVTRGLIPSGVAADDGAAIHFVDGEMEQVVSSREGARAYAVELDRAGDDSTERVLETRFLG